MQITKNNFSKCEGIGVEKSKNQNSTNVHENFEKIGIFLPKLFWPTVRNGILLP